MADNKKSGIGLVVILSVVFVGIATFFAIKGFATKPKKREGKEGEGEKEEEPKKKTSSVVVGDLQSVKLDDIITNTDWKFPIKFGQKNNSVKSLQLLIRKLNPSYIKSGATGYFGNETKSAVNKILGKDSVDNIDEINKISLTTTVNKAAANWIINAQLGLPSDTSIVK